LTNKIQLCCPIRELPYSVFFEVTKMGQTLDKPNLDKDTHFGENDYLSFAVSGMQGYRLTMEDAHNIFGNVDLSKFDEKVQKDTNISFFGIYDGHSGKEIFI
jgi:protein phosphatase PTC2/3